MKNTMALLFCILILGCTHTPIENDAPKPVFISGKIENPKTDIAIFRAGEGDSKIADTAYLDSSGYFSTLIEITEEGFGNFYHGGERTSMFFVPGDSIELTIDTKEFDETIAYQGNGAAANNYLAKKYLINEINTPSYPDLYSMEPDSFLNAVDTLQALLTNHLDLYKSQNPNTSEKLTNKEKIEIVYKYAAIKLNYAENHKGQTEKDPIDIQPGFYEFMSGLDINDTLLFRTNNFYSSFIKAFLNKEVYQNLMDETGPKNAIVKLQTKIKVAHTLFKVKEISEKLIYSSIRSHLKWRGASSMEEIIKDFETTSDNEEYKIEVRELYDQMQLLAEGNDAPGFAYPNIEGDTIALNDFLGKYIYVDIWATWCGPCLRELPYLEKLQEEYIDKNIVFLSVSIDEDHDAWEKMVTEKEMKGVQLIATKGWKAAICDEYVIKSIPRFLLIDREGRIITARAERPSGKIEELLKYLEGISS